MYKITDIVETGHWGKIGGTIEISITVKSNIPDAEQIKQFLDIIDRFDHCLITDNEESIKYSERYILIEKRGNLLLDIYHILSYFIKDYPHVYVDEISVKRGKETFYDKPLIAKGFVKSWKTEG